MRVQRFVHGFSESIVNTVKTLNTNVLLINNKQKTSKHVAVNYNSTCINPFCFIK